jgi:ArsR family transcriptional regulator
MKSLESIVALFEALADPTRLRLLNLMRDGEVCVCFFVEILGERQPKISRHLSYLRRAGIVTARRDGKWMHYGIAMPTEESLRRVLSDTLAWMEADPGMKRDRNRLVKVCCASSLPVQLQGAPLPTPVDRRRTAVST